jgi:hypothetical protein
MAASLIDTLKSVRADLRDALSRIVDTDKYCDNLRRKVVREQMKQIAAQNDRQRAKSAERIVALNQDLAQMEQRLAELVEQRDRLLRREQELAPQVDELKHQRFQYVLPSGAMESVKVRMLSGDELNVMLDPNQKVRELPQEFAGQFGYNPKVVSRFQFLIDNQDGEIIHLIGNEEHHDLSWLERFTSMDQVPLLHLLINANSDADLPQKIRLIRNIAEDGKLKCSLSDDDLMEHFNHWYLTYQPPVKSNRYTTMNDFIKSCPEMFQPISHEDLMILIEESQSIANRKDQLEEQIQIINYNIEDLKYVIRIRLHEQYEQDYIDSHTRRNDEYQHGRIQAALAFAQELREDPTAEFMFTNRRRHFNHYLTRFEMVEMGWTQALNPNIKCQCERIRCASNSIYLQTLWDLHRSHIQEHGNNSTAIIHQQIHSLSETVDQLSGQHHQLYIDMSNLNYKIDRIRQ